MIEPTDIEGRIALQMNAIVGDAMRQADRWRSSEARIHLPPLFVMPGVELPIVTRIAPARKETRR